MKRIKYFIPVLLALVMVLAIPLAACKKKEGPKTLQSIEVVEAVKAFTVGEEFTSAGLVVKANFTVNSTGETKEEMVSGANCEIDSKAYNKDEVGKYPIVVSYTSGTVTKETTYEVEVAPHQDGINVSLADGVEDTYYLSADMKSVEIDTSKIVVNGINKDGSLGEEISGYTVKLFKGKEEISLTGGKATVSSGAYTIWAEKESVKYPGFMMSGFAVIYVNDDIESVVKKTGVFEQPEGVDLISGSWVFTVNYVSGASKDISKDDCSMTIDTMKKGEQVAKATYTERNAKGEVISKNFDVPYSITQFTGTRHDFAYNYDAIDYSGWSKDTILTNADLKDANSFLKVGDGEALYRNKTAWGTGADTIEIKNKGLLITIEGTGSIAIGVGSTGGSNTSRFGLMDEDGNYLPASYDRSKTNIALDDSEDEDGNLYENVYLVTGASSSKDACVFTYVIAKPGTYALVSEPNAAYNRGCRIWSISVIDYVPDEVGAAVNSVASDNQTYIVYKKESV